MSASDLSPALSVQLAAELLAVRCPSNIRVSVQARLPFLAAALRAYRAKRPPASYLCRRPFVIVGVTRLELAASTSLK